MTDVLQLGIFVAVLVAWRRGLRKKRPKMVQRINSPAVAFGLAQAIISAPARRPPTPPLNARRRQAAWRQRGREAPIRSTLLSRGLVGVSFHNSAYPFLRLWSPMVGASRALKKVRLTMNASESRGEQIRIGWETLFTFSTAC